MRLLFWILWQLPTICSQWVRGRAVWLGVKPLTNTAARLLLQTFPSWVFSIFVSSARVSAMLLSLALATATTAATASANDVRAIRIGENDATYRFVFETTKAVTPDVLVLANPTRLVIDIPAIASVDLANEDFASLESALVNNTRSSHNAAKKARFVFELNTDTRVRVLSQASLPPPTEGALHRYYVDVALTGKLIPRTIDSGQPANASRQRVVRDDVFTIALDAGHGGVDPGATHGHIHEKTIVLQFARSLKKELEKNPAFRVVMIRDDDVIVPLKERHLIAEREGANLFLSLHADDFSHNQKYVKQVRGMTFYTLSDLSLLRTVRNRQSQEVKAVVSSIDASTGQVSAAVENALVESSGLVKLTESDQLAEVLGRHARDCGFTLSRRELREGGMAVLKSIKLPSVLIEIGYLSHAEDRKLLLSSAYREKFSRCMAGALSSYLAP